MLLVKETSGRASPEEAVIACSSWRAPAVVCRRAGSLELAARLVLVFVIKEPLQLIIVVLAVIIVVVLCCVSLLPVCSTAYTRLNYHCEAHERVIGHYLPGGHSSEAPISSSICAILESFAPTQCMHFGLAQHFTAPACVSCYCSRHTFCKRFYAGVFITVQFLIVEPVRQGDGRRFSLPRRLQLDALQQLVHLYACAAP